MSTEKKYTLKNPLHPEATPVLIDATGRRIDGVHRLDEFPDWPQLTLKDVDTNRKFFSLRIRMNTNRRQVPQEETASDLNNLAAEIIREEGPSAFRHLAQILSNETTLSIGYVQSLLDDKYKMPKAKPEPRARSPKLEGGALSVETPTTPRKDSAEFDKFALDVIAKYVGGEYDLIVLKVMTICGLERDEAVDYVKRWKDLYGPLWSRIYDSENKLLRREEPQPVPRPAAPEPPSPEPGRGPVYSRDTLLEEAMKWYPEVVLDNVWDVVPNRDSKLPFIKACIGECFTMCVDEFGLDSIVNRTLEKIR